MTTQVSFYRNTSISLLLASALLVNGCDDSEKKVAQTAPHTEAEVEIAQPTPLTSDRVSWVKTVDNCAELCPSLRVNLVIFPDNPKLNTMLEQNLLSMVDTTAETEITIHSLQDYAEHYLQYAEGSDETVLETSLRFENGLYTVIEQLAYTQADGSAHGLSTSEFVNWDNQREQFIALDDMLLPEAKEVFFSKLEAAHQAWLKETLTAEDDPQQWLSTWPFLPSENVALTEQGVLVKYEPYAIAPYSSGQPELFIPYAELTGIFKPEYLLSP